LQHEFNEETAMMKKNRLSQAVALAIAGATLSVAVMSDASAAATAYEFEPFDLPETGWITGVDLQALYLIDQTQSINNVGQLNARLNPSLPDTVGTVDVSGSNPNGPITGVFATTGGTPFGGFVNPFTKIDTPSNPISGNFTLPAGTDYVGLKDGTGGILVGVFSHTLNVATQVNFLMTWTDLVGNNVNQTLSNYFYGANDNVNLPGVGDPIPVPAATWLFGGALASLIGVHTRRRVVPV
jgi:hypothetical protein